MELHTETYTYGDVSIEVRRSKVKDALRRDMIRRALELKYGSEQLDVISAFARAVTQSSNAKGLPFDPANVTPGNADEAYQQIMEYDEVMLTEWYNVALRVNMPIDPVLASGIDTDLLKKKRIE